MSEKLSTLKKEDEGEYKVPDTVWNANWRDDIPEEGEAEDAEIGFQFFSDEIDYQNNKRDEDVDLETKRRIELLNLKHQKIGLKAIELGKVA
ncbi:hypothetical protein IJF86_01420 [Candidatus Saccharibacteria bacterium]|nr:hypothetical protein [Candidatus Saccharibacteria bacterium]